MAFIEILDKQLSVFFFPTFCVYESHPSCPQMYHDVFTYLRPGNLRPNLLLSSRLPLRVRDNRPWVFSSTFRNSRMPLGGLRCGLVLFRYVDDINPGSQGDLPILLHHLHPRCPACPPLGLLNFQLPPATCSLHACNARPLGRSPRRSPCPPTLFRAASAAALPPNALPSLSLL